MTEHLPMFSGGILNGVYATCDCGWRAGPFQQQIRAYRAFALHRAEMRRG